MKPYLPIAVVGMHVNAPGAANVDEFWEIVREGREVTYFSDEELEMAGVRELCAPTLVSSPRARRCPTSIVSTRHFSASIQAMPHPWTHRSAGSWRARGVSSRVPATIQGAWMSRSESTPDPPSARIS